MLFNSAMRKLENDRTLVMYRASAKKYVHLTNGITLTEVQTRDMLTADVSAKKLSYMMVTVEHDLIIPYTPNMEDVLATDWQVKPMEREDRQPRFTGIVRLRQEDLAMAIDVVESYGYGEFVSSFTDKKGNTYATFDSTLFREVKSGEPTPEYLLTVDQVNRTIRAKPVSV